MSDALERVELRSPDFVFVDQPLLDPSAIRDTTIIFRPTDLFPPGQAEDRARKLAATSAGLAATSPGVMAAYGGFCRGPKLVLENGVEFPRFRSVVDTNPSKEYDFVYVGALDERFDFESLAEAARRNPTASFVLFGPIPSARPNLPDNVDLRGTIGYDDVPLVMSRGRWGMMPFLQSDLNTSRSPMKLYEYVAAGLPVVAPAATLSRAGSLRGGHAFDGATSSFANVVSDLLRRNEDGFDERDLRVAAAVDWRSVANRLLDFASDVRNAL